MCTVSPLAFASGAAVSRARSSGDPGAAARQGRVADDGTWTLIDAEVARWPAARGAGDAGVQIEHHAEMNWPSTLRPSVVAAAVLPAVGVKSAV